MSDDNERDPPAENGDSQNESDQEKQNNGPARLVNFRSSFDAIVLIDATVSVSGTGDSKRPETKPSLNGR